MIRRLCNLSSEEYRNFHAVSQSDLKSVWNNPARYALRVPAEPTPAMQWGIDCEEYLRTGELKNAVLIPDSVLNKNGHRMGSAWSAFAAEHQGRRLITQEEMVALQSAYVSVRSHGPAARMVWGGGYKWSQRFTWLAAGRQYKAELDLLSRTEGVVCDVKTTADPDRTAFARDCWSYGYDVQAAMYLWAVQQAFPEVLSWKYRWVVIRNKPLHDVEVYEATEELLAIGSERLLSRIEFYWQCHDSGRWVSRTHGQVVPLDLPRYAREEQC